MKSISRVQAFIDIVEALQAGDEVKANKMINVVGKSIAADKKGFQYTPEIELKRYEKELFAK